MYSSMAVSARTMRVLVVDDHRTFADLLALALDGESDLECVGTAHSVTDAQGMVEALQPDLVLMDVQVGAGDGIETTACLTAAYPHLRVVVLTAFVTPALMQRAADAGACALLPKDGSLREMLSAVRSARRDGFQVQPGLLMELVRTDEPRYRPTLTSREHQVLDRLAAGHNTRRISRDLNISVSTCRGYVKTVLAKLGAHSQLEAVVIAQRHGLTVAPATD